MKDSSNTQAASFDDLKNASQLPTADILRSPPFSFDEGPVPPESRYRWRADGGRDETFRLNFVGPLTAMEMQQMIDLLLQVAQEGTHLGITALTKVEFVEPDTCEYRYWCAEFTNDRVNKMLELWYRLNQIHAVRAIDGVPYSLYFPSDSSRRAKS